MKKLLAVAILLAVFFSAGLGVFVQPLLYTLTPLQRYYLGTYLASSWKATDPTATTEVQWVWKSRPETEAPPKRKGNALPKFQYEMATEDDVVPIPPGDLLWKGDRLPFTISAKAGLEEGWYGVVWRGPVEVNSAQLYRFLRHHFFEDRPLWQFCIQPTILIAACVLLWLVYRSWRNGYRDRRPWQTSGQFWRERMLDARTRLQKRLEAGRSRQELPAPPVRVIEAVRTEPKRIAPPVPKAVAATATEAPTQPPAAAVRAVVPPVPQPVLWDESKGLE